MKTYEAVFDAEHNTGVYGISLVQNPAMEGNFIALNKDEKLVRFKDANKEEQLIMGLILEPNKPIYRRNGEKEYNIIFSENTVKKAAHLYMKNLNNNNATLDHKEKVDGVSLVETWLVRDPKRDASNVFGKEYKKGARACVLKVHNKDQWEEYKENGTTNISLEGVFKPKKEDQKSNLESKLSILKSIAKDLK